MAAKQTVPQVPLKAGAADYAVVLDFNTLCELEQEFNLGINQIIAKFGTSATLRLGEVRTFLRYALRRDGERLEPSAADEVCNAAGHDACTDAVTAALIAAFGSGE